MDEIEKMIKDAETKMNKAKDSSKKYIDSNDYDKAMSKIIIASQALQEWNILYQLKGKGII